MFFNLVIFGNNSRGVKIRKKIFGLEKIEKNEIINS